jgi:hypothetical protein
MLDPDNDGGINLNEFRYAWFNKGKVTRIIHNDDDGDDQSSIFFEKRLRQKAVEELKSIEKTYQDRALLILNSSLG